jgi:hypothetical protein
VLVLVVRGGGDGASGPAAEAEGTTGRATEAAPAAVVAAAPSVEVAAAVDAPTGGSMAAAEEAGASAPGPMALPDRPAPRNPWTKDTPRELRVIRKKITAGERGDDRMIAALRKYNKSTELDARAHLLLARMYLNRGWLQDALKQYELVCAIDVSARGAPMMLADLLALAADSRTSRDASRLVRDAYRREALVALDAKLMMPSTDPAATERLRALRASLLADAR